MNGLAQGPAALQQGGSVQLARLRTVRVETASRPGAALGSGRIREPRDATTARTAALFDPAQVGFVGGGQAAVDEVAVGTVLDLVLDDALPCRPRADGAGEVAE